jgi:selenocysteine-specific translation elongation factor
MKLTLVLCGNSPVMVDMGNLIVAVLGASDYASSLGKKGTASDITLYDLKRGLDSVTFVEPTRYPERLAPLFYAVAMADKALVVVDELNSTFGECLVMLQCSNVNGGYFILRNYLSREKIEPLIRGTCLERFEFIEDNPTLLRERFITEAALQEPENDEEAVGTVPLDHAFNVKGVETVVLGTVTNGSIMKHDTMQVLPGGKTTQVRSIQKQDDEFDSAYEVERVGLALRNIEVADLDRGTVLTRDPAVKSSKLLDTHASLVKYWPARIKTGMILHLGHWMQFINGRVEAVTDEEDWRKPVLTVALDKELVHRPGDQAVLMYLEGGKLRVAGTIELP